MDRILESFSENKRSSLEKSGGTSPLWYHLIEIPKIGEPRKNSEGMETDHPSNNFGDTYILRRLPGFHGWLLQVESNLFLVELGYQMNFFTVGSE